ncbi:MAG: hypothetical protein EOP54_23310 [Sphingobacteriales bacterium]|nr:MAG: hypothetical protein EOP54_23310 [Sphingobacteriales bacterium]
MGRLLYTTLLILLFNLTGKAQEIDMGTVDYQLGGVYVPDIAPQYPGGVEAFKKYVADNLNPTEAGMLRVQFVVEKDGSLSSIIILKGINKKTDRRLINVLKKSPLWTPGSINGKPIRTMYTVPITVKVND